MKAIRIVLLLILLFPVSAFAGNIFGNLKEEGRSVGPGVAVQIKCGGDGPVGKTDEYGAYSINVPRGRCELTVNYRGQWTPPFQIASSDDPARYDFDVVNEKGQYVLRRR